MRGCVTQKDGRWYVVFYDRVTKKHKWSGFATKAEAEKFQHKTALHLMNGGSLPDSRLTVQTYLDEWLNIRKNHIDDISCPKPKGKIRSTTWARYEELIRLHIAPALGTIPMTKLKPLMVDKFYADKQATISSATVQQIHLVLHKAFQDAFRKDVTTGNVFDKVDAPGILHAIRKKAPWDFEQARLFLAEAHRSSKWYVLYLFTLCTGSRESEVLGLQRSDVDLLMGEVHFQRKMYRLYHKGLGKKILEGPPKSSRGIRDIPLIPQVVDELRKHLAAQDVLRAEFGNTYSQDGNGQLVFCQPNGKYLHMSYIIARDFKKVIERARLPIIRFHDLKHCAASFLRALGVDSYTVSAICGHHSAAFTDQHYVHAVDSTMREAMKRLENALSLTPPENP